jgi:hypothetical protein
VKRIAEAKGGLGFEEGSLHSSRNVSGGHLLYNVSQKYGIFAKVIRTAIHGGFIGTKWLWMRRKILL